MTTNYFKILGYKAPGGRMVLMMVVDENMFGQEMPEIFELQAVNPPPTIYTGTYPTIRINTDTITDRNDLAGQGMAGMALSEPWYYAERDKPDPMGINLTAADIENVKKRKQNV